MSPLRGLLSRSGKKIKKNLWDQGTNSHEPLHKSLLLIHATGGWGTPLFRPNGHVPYKQYRYVAPQKVGFFRRFGLKTGTHFAHIGLESGTVFEGTKGVYEGICRSNSK